MKNFKNIFIILILIFFVIEILTTSDAIIASVKFSFDLWINNVFPSLFPFFVISELLIYYGFVELIGEFLKPFMKIFKSSSNSAFILIMSIISGTPSSAKNICNMYKEKLITKEEATKILMFTFFPNPLFVLGPLALQFLNNKTAGIIILISCYLSNILIGIIFRNFNPSYNKDKINFKNALTKINNKRISNNFGKIITNSLVSSINTLLLILGVITFANVITTTIDKNINLNNYYQSILNGFIEMTQGLKHISILEIPLKLKTTLSGMIISFGGISTHLQIISILSDTDIKYFPFLVSRILQTVLSILFIYFTFDFWINLL